MLSLAISFKKREYYIIILRELVVSDVILSFFLLELGVDRHVTDVDIFALGSCTVILLFFLY